MSDQSGGAEGFNIGADFSEVVGEFDKLLGRIERYNADITKLAQQTKHVNSSIVSITTDINHYTDAIKDVLTASGNEMKVFADRFNTTATAIKTRLVEIRRVKDDMMGGSNYFGASGSGKANAEGAYFNPKYFDAATAGAKKLTVEEQKLYDKERERFNLTLALENVMERAFGRQIDGAVAQETHLIKQINLRRQLALIVKDTSASDAIRQGGIDFRGNAANAARSNQSAVQSAIDTQVAQRQARIRLEAQFRLAAGELYTTNTPVRGHMISGPMRQRLSPVQMQDNLNARNAAEAANQPQSSSIGLMQSAKYFATYRALSAVKDTLEDATKAAYAFSKSLTLIQTITVGTGKTFEDFRAEIMSVSNLFGLQVEDVAQATYDALSNQVVKAGESFGFMAEAAKFARATNSTLTEAVNLGSSAINSYGLSADQANSVFAKFFKTIDLGRVKASEIANSIGTVTTVAAPLGVKLEEVNAALATLTVRGVTEANAMTFLRNVMIKIAKPTEEMRDFLDSLGFSTGQAAVQTLTFAGFMDKLFKEIDGNTERAGELVSNIRAIQGVMGLAEQGSLSFTNTLQKMNSAQADYGVVTDKIVQESAAVTLSKQWNEVRNQFVSMAVSIINGLNKLAPAGNAFKLVVDGLVIAVVALTLAYGANAIASRTAAIAAAQHAAIQAGLAGSTIILTDAQIALASQTTILSRAFTALSAHPVILALSLIAGGIWYAHEAQKEFNEQSELTVQKYLTDLTNKLNKDLAPALEEIAQKYQRLGLIAAEQRKIVVKSFEDQKDAVEKLKDAVIRSFEEQTTKVKEELNKIRAEENKLNTDIITSRKKLAEDKRSQQRADFEEEIAGLSDVEKAKRLLIQAEIDQNKAKQLSKSINPEDIDQARKLAAQAMKDTQEAKKLNPDAAKSNSIDLNILLRKRERATRDLTRLEGFINALSGSERSGANARRQGLLEDINNLDQQISDKRGLPRLPGRRDDNDARMRAAKQTQIAVEKNYQDTIRDTVTLDDARVTILEKTEAALKKNRDAFGDFLSLIKKAADSKDFDKILLKLTALSAVSFGDTKAAIELMVSGLKDQQVKAGAVEGTSKTEASLKKKQELESGLLEYQKQGPVLRAANDAKIIEILATQLDNNMRYTQGEAGRQLYQTLGLGELVRFAKERQTKANDAKDRGLQVDPNLLTLSDEQRAKIQTLSTKANERIGLGLAGSQGLFSDEEQKALRQIGTLVNQQVEMSDKLKNGLNDLLKPIDDVKNSLFSLPPAINGILKYIQQGGEVGGDSKASGGYSVGGGVHHAGEYILNPKSTRRYRTLLEQLNKNGDESFLQDKGSKGYFDTLAALQPFLNKGIVSVGGGIPIFGNRVGDDYLNSSGRRDPFTGFSQGSGWSPLQQQLVSGLRNRLSGLSGINFDDFGKTGFDLNPRIMPGFEPKSTRDDGRQVFQFGDVSIVVSGPNVNSRQIAADIRRDIGRSLSSL